MNRVKCRGCGKVYNYQQDEICPNCGAYNRPPHREIVEADGTVHDVRGDDKVCYEEQVCYEEKQCHEEVARQVRGEEGKTAWETDDLEVALHKGVDRLKSLAERASKSQKNPTLAQKKWTLIIGVAVAVLSLLGNWLDNREWTSEPTPEVGYEAVEVETELQYHGMGETFIANGMEITVEAAKVGEKKVVVDICMPGNDELWWEPTLYWHDDSGSDHSLLPDEGSLDEENTLWQYIFDTSDLEEYHYEPDEEGYYIGYYEFADENKQTLHLVSISNV